MSGRIPFAPNVRVLIANEKPEKLRGAWLMALYRIDRVSIVLLFSHVRRFGLDG